MSSNLSFAPSRVLLLSFEFSNGLPPCFTDTRVPGCFLLLEKSGTKVALVAVMAEFLWLLAKRSATAAVISISLADTVGNVARTQGESMQPTLKSGDSHLLGALKGDIVFFEKLSAPAYKYSRGDVIVLRSPMDPNQWMVKRLIALQGDWINVPGSYEILQIPKGRCWIEGDNGNVSLDSRTFGAIPLGLVKGRVTHKIWPPSRVGRVERVLPAGRVMLDDGAQGP